jgi:2-octaprenyl-6-methoxyphenol hydroxylase
MSSTPDPAPRNAPPRLAVIGAGPVGMTLALLMRARCPSWQVEVFDARPLDRDVSGDPRTLALSLGSLQVLDRLGTFRRDTAEPIREVHVSQTSPSLSALGVLGPLGEALGEPVVWIRAIDEAVPQLGAVVSYGALLAPMQAALVAAGTTGPLGDAPGLRIRFGAPVTGLTHEPDGQSAVVVLGGDPAGDSASSTSGSEQRERFDLAVVAEGGVFGEQARKPLHRDYGQVAWVGTVELEGATPGRAIERFTREGPLALLPLPGAASRPDRRRAALVWCVPIADDLVEPLTDTQRLAVLNERLPEVAGRVVAVSPLKRFPLGLNAETRLVDRRVLRIGNAAQTLHPVAGQGLNLGLRDAFVLAEALAKQGPAPTPAGLARALGSVAWSRGPDRWSTIAATDFLARSFTWHLPGMAAARGLGLAALQAMGPVKSALARQMMFGRR